MFIPTDKEEQKRLKAIKVTELFKPHKYGEKWNGSRDTKGFFELTENLGVIGGTVQKGSIVKVEGYSGEGVTIRYGISADENKKEYRIPYSIAEQIFYKTEECYLADIENDNRKEKYWSDEAKQQRIQQVEDKFISKMPKFKLRTKLIKKFIKHREKIETTTLFLLFLCPFMTVLFGGIGLAWVYQGLKDVTTAGESAVMTYFLTEGTVIGFIGTLQGIFGRLKVHHFNKAYQKIEDAVAEISDEEYDNLMRRTIQKDYQPTNSATILDVPTLRTAKQITAKPTVPTPFDLLHKEEIGGLFLYSTPQNETAVK